MSAQMIDALRRRAALLEKAITPEPPLVTTDLADQPAPSLQAVQNMIYRVLAGELLAFAGEAELLEARSRPETPS